MVEELASKGASAAPGADWALSRVGPVTAENYLKEQTRLARLQADGILREDRIRHRLLHFTHASTIMKLAFELSPTAHTSDSPVAETPHSELAVPGVGAGTTDQTTPL